MVMRHVHRLQIMSDHKSKPSVIAGEMCNFTRGNKYNCKSNYCLYTGVMNSHSIPDNINNKPLVSQPDYNYTPGSGNEPKILMTFCTSNIFILAFLE